MAEALQPPRELDRIRLSPMRRMTIEAMHRSQATAIPVTVITEARIEALLAAKSAFAGAGSRVSLTALLARILATTLAEHPDVNAALTETDIVRFADVNLGVAVSLPDGNLTAPAIRRAHEMDVPELSARIIDLSERARRGKVTLSDVRGGTFTLSNIGMVMPGGTGTAVIPPGQCGILVAGGVLSKPVVQEEHVVPGKVIPLSMTFDHRVVNGVPAWNFLRELVARLENPTPWLSAQK